MNKYTVVGTVLVVVLFGLLSTVVLSQKPETKVEAFHKSLQHENAGEYGKAIQVLLPVVKEQKDDYLLNLRLGWLSYLAGSFTESKQYYSKAVSTSSKSVEALLGRTLPLASLNEWSAVEEDYRAILKIDPMEYTANLRLGQILLNRGAYADARAHLERALTLYPSSYEPNLSLGWTCYYLGDRKRAGVLLTTALMLSPGDTLAIKGLNLLR
jgi:tetratricopeptide (TPR) repeat protein